MTLTARTKEPVLRIGLIELEAVGVEGFNVKLSLVFFTASSPLP